MQRHKQTGPFDLFLCYSTVVLIAEGLPPCRFDESRFVPALRLRSPRHPAARGQHVFPVPHRHVRGFPTPRLHDRCQINIKG